MGASAQNASNRAAQVTARPQTCNPDLAEIAEIRKFIPNYTLPDPSLYIDFYTICGLHPGTREKLESLGIIFDEYQISDKDLWIEPGLLPSTTDSQ